MSKIARVKFIRDKEPNIKALTAENKVLDGALYVATDTGTLWMGISSSSLIQIKDNINTNTTYNLTKSGNTITLRGSDGSTFNVTDSNTVYGNATTSAAGLMSAADKAKLDGVAAGSNHVTVDAELSTTSTNPVQNKVIKSALDGKSNTGHTHDDRYYTETEINTKLNGKSNTGHKHVKADITDFPTSMPASDVSAWAKAATKPSYSKAEVGLGNVDNTADSAKSVKYAASAGSATTAATANALKVTELTTQNLDDTKTVGLYFAGGSNSVKNKPTGIDAFGLEVKRTAGGYLVQVLTEGNTNAMKTWIRQFNASAWSAWAHYFDSNHTPTWSQVSSKPSFATVATSGSYNDLSNKPTIPTVPSSLKNPNALTISLNGTSQGAYDGSAVKNINITASSVGAAASSHTHTKAQITDFPTSMPASDVYSWAKQSSKPSYTISEVSGNLPASRISGTISAANLPSYVDDVLEYASFSKFPTTGESGKIYTALDTNKIYRWSGSAYVVISETIALGTTHSSAGYGDESRAAYNHSTKTSGNPHHVTKTDVGLGNVDNTADSAKSVKYATSAGSAGSVAWANVSGRPSSMPASDVYSWAKQPSKPSYTASEVGAAPASHSHSYLPLSGGTISGNVHFASIGDKAKAAGITWDGSTDGASIYYETRGSDSGHLVLNMIDGSNVTVDIAAGGAVQSYFGYDGTFHGNVSGNASSASSVAWTNVSGRPSSMPASDVYAWAKASSKPSYSWSEISNKPSIPSVGNGTITITQNGATKGSFTLNQSGNATIALTDNDTNTWRPEEVIVSSSQPNASTCKLWIKV